MNFQHFLAPLRIGRAYLDPGTGSFLLQLVVAAVLGALFFLRGYIARFFKFIRNLFVKKTPEVPTEVKSEDGPIQPQ